MSNTFKSAIFYLSPFLIFGFFTACTKNKSSDSPIEVDPVPTSGTNNRPLIDINKTRVMCGTSSLGNSYRVDCRAGILQLDGSVIEAKDQNDIAPGVTLEWQAPKKVEGAEILDSHCTLGEFNLSQTCELKLVGNGESKLQVDLKTVKASTNESSVESALVFLPFSVKSYGYSPAVPMEFSVEEPSGPKSKEQKFIFKNRKFDALTSDFGAIVQACQQGSKFYFVSNTSVYVYDEGKVSIFAGSANPSNGNTSPNPLRVFFGNNIHIACAKDSIYVMNTGIFFKIENGKSTVLKYPVGKKGEPSIGSSLNGSGGMYMISDGVFLVSETPNHRIFKVNFNANTSQLIAGTGVRNTVTTLPISGPLPGDGGLATQAQLSFPRNITQAKDGSIYFLDRFYLDTQNGDSNEPSEFVVRKIDPNGIIKTIGTLPFDNTFERVIGGSYQPIGLLVNDEGKLLFSAMYRGNVPNPKPHAIGVMDDTGAVGELNLIAPDGVPSEDDAKLSFPAGLFFDDLGNLMISDAGNHVLKRRTPDGLVRAVIGTSKTPKNTISKSAVDAVYGDNSGMALTPDGSIFYYDNSTKRLMKISKSHELTPVTVPPNAKRVDGGDAATQSLDLVYSVASGPDGSVYVGNARQIFRIDTQGKLHIFAGRSQPDALHDDDHLADVDNHLGDKGPAVDAWLANVQAMTFDSAGNMYFSDAGHLRIRKITTDGLIDTIAGTGDSLGVSGDNGPAVAATVGHVKALTIAVNNQLFFSATDTHTAYIRKIDLNTGIVTTVAGNGTLSINRKNGMEALGNPLAAQDLTALPDGKILFIDTGTNMIRSLVAYDAGGGVFKYKVTNFFGSVQQMDCGGGNSSGSALESNLQGELKAHLGVQCVGGLQALTSYSSCSASGGTVTVAFGQKFNKRSYSGNIVRVERACTPEDLIQ